MSHRNRNRYLLAASPLVTLMGWCAPQCTPSKPTCEAGEIVVWASEEVPCDLVGNVNTLTILGLPNEAACDQHGGAWVYEACDLVDF